MDCPQLRNGKGYDHNFILDGGDGEKVAAELYSPDTGIAMTVRHHHARRAVLQRECVGWPGRKSGVPYETNNGLVLGDAVFPPMRCRAAFSVARCCIREALYVHDTSFTFSCK